MTPQLGSNLRPDSSHLAIRTGHCLQDILIFLCSESPQRLVLTQSPFELDLGHRAVHFFRNGCPFNSSRPCLRVTIDPLVQLDDLKRKYKWNNCEQTYSKVQSRKQKQLTSLSVHSRSTTSLSSCDWMCIYHLRLHCRTLKSGPM